jgi:hypothetical protein
MIIRVNMAVQSFVIELVHSSSFVKFSVSPISFNKGAGANQTMNARKNDIHAQCKALMWGLLKDKRLI